MSQILQKLNNTKVVNFEYGGKKKSSLFPVRDFLMDISTPGLMRPREEHGHVTFLDQRVDHMTF